MSEKTRYPLVDGRRVAEELQGQIENLLATR
jgi:hypothetical protein